MNGDKNSETLPKEIEATFINIDKEQYRAKLRTLGAELVQPEILMRRVVFDMGEHQFVRVRDEGNKITMSYKRHVSPTLSGMREICLEVNDYELAIEFLKAVGLKIKAEQEAYREEWRLDGVEITIDTWPWLPAYTEIEGPSEEAVAAVAGRLGLNLEQAIYGSADEVYKKYYEVTSDQVNTRARIMFDEEVGWAPRQGI